MLPDSIMLAFSYNVHVYAYSMKCLLVLIVVFSVFFQTSAPVQEEVIEASISQDTAKTTGDTVENPEYTKTLDEAAKS